MERIVIIVNGFQPLTIITKCTILDVAAALDSSLICIKFCKHNIKFIFLKLGEEEADILVTPHLIRKQNLKQNFRTNAKQDEYSSFFSQL